MMTPALAILIFYAGFVRSRNVLNTMVMSFTAMALVSVLWVLYGYSLAFSPGSGPLAPSLGGLQWAGLSNRDQPYGDGQLSHGAVALFQATFAIITPALISGAVVERMHFRAWLLFVVLWSTVISMLLAPMVWAPGGLLGPDGLGALDFAGGLVVEIASGVGALVATLMVGPGRSDPQAVAPPHNVPLILLGAGLLWFGWFGFNGGSGLVAGNSGLAGLHHHQQRRGRGGADLDGGRNPAAGPTHRRRPGHRLGGRPGGDHTGGGLRLPMAALGIGLVAALVCSGALQLKTRLRLDDSLDVLPVHGVAGLVGTLLTGVFALRSLNPAGADGLITGRATQLGIQLSTAGFTILWVGVGTFALLALIRLVLPLRVSGEQERQGLDISAHGEEAYNTEFTG